MPGTKTGIPLWRKYLTVEPVVFFYFYGFLMYLPVSGIYIYHRVSDMKRFPYQNFSQQDGGCGDHEDLATNELWELELEVQTLSSKIYLAQNLVVTIPSLLVVPLWGPWTDKGGKRKPALQVGILGACLDLTVLLLVMYLNLSVYFLFLGAVISGFSGFAPVIMTGATSYIADVSSEEERTFRIAVLYMQIFLAGVISQLTSGLWIDNVGFIPSAWFILACFLLAGIWTLFCVPESRTTADNIPVRFFSTENIKSFFNFFRKQREAGRKNLLLSMVCSGLFFLVTVGVDGVITLYILKSPLCWNATLIGYFFAFALFLRGFGSVAGVKFFGRCFRELTVARFGMVSLALSMIMLAFSNRTWLVFVASAVGIFGAVPDPILGGGMSRIVGDSQQGVLFSAHGVVSAIAQLVGALLFNSVYQATLSLFPGLVFILCALLVLIPLLLLSFIELPPIKINDLMAGENYDLKGRNVHKEIANENDVKANQVANTVL